MVDFDEAGLLFDEAGLAYDGGPIHRLWRVIILCIIEFAEGTEYIASEYYCSQPGDSPASEVFDSRLDDVRYERGISCTIWTGQNSPPRPVNELRFVNADGAISAWIDRDVRDITVTLKRAYVDTYVDQAAESWKSIPLPAFETVATLRGDQIRADGEDYVVMSMRSWIDVFREAQKGNDRPMVLGRVSFVRPVTIDEDGLVYTMFSPYLQSLEQLLQSGEPLTAGGVDYTVTSSGFDLIAPAAGLLQADYKGIKDTTSGVWRETIPQCINWLMTDGGDFDPITVDGSLASAIPAYAASYSQVGARPVLDIMQDLLASANGFMWPHRDGNLRFAVLSAPSGTPVLEIVEDDLISDLQLTADLALGLTQSARFNINAAVAQDNDIDAGADPSDRLAALRPYDSVSTGTAPNGKYEPAQLREARVLHLRSTTDAQTVLSNSCALYVDKNAYFARLTIGVRDSASTANSIEPNDVVRLTHSRYGLSSGVLARVVWAASSLLSQDLELILWYTVDA